MSTDKYGNQVRASISEKEGIDAPLFSGQMNYVLVLVENMVTDVLWIAIDIFLFPAAMRLHNRASKLLFREKLSLSALE